jgi:hypothetical protein
MRRVVPLLLALATVLLGGCATAGPLDPPAQNPSDLVGIWRVDAAGEGDSTWLKLGDQAVLWNDCGTALGAWRATGSLFVAGMVGSVGPWCHSHDFAFPGWLDAASGYLAVPGKVRLVAADGHVLATLRHDGAPPANPDAPDLTTEPTVSAGITESFRVPAALPGDATPVAVLAGRWTPRDAVAGRDPFVEFAADHAWTGSDGCNGAGGRWLLGDAGLLLATSGASTAIGCDNSAGPGWVAQASRVGMVGGDLTFYDATGAVLGSFTAS